MNEIIQDICEDLRRIRRARRISLDEVADATNIGKGNLSRYENGKLIPKFDTIGRWADALDVAVKVSLFDRQDAKEYCRKQSIAE